MSIYRNRNSAIGNGALYCRIGGSNRLLTQLYCRQGGNLQPLLNQPTNGVIAMLSGNTINMSSAALLKASLARIGRPAPLEITDRTATGLAAVLTGAQFLLIPRNGTNLDGEFDTAAKQQLQDFVARGGHLLMNYTQGMNLPLLTLFGISSAAFELPPGSYYNVQAAIAPFQAWRLPPLLGYHANVGALMPTVSADIASQILYRDANMFAVVASFKYGRGRLSYLGWDWYPDTDGNWETVLRELLNA